MRATPARLLVLLLVPLLALGWLRSEQRVTLVTPDGVTKVRTHAGTVGALLARHGIDPDEVDVDPPPWRRLRRGMTVTVQPAPRVVVVPPRPAAPVARSGRLPALPEVTLTADGASRRLHTAAATVAGVLTEAGVAVDGDDRVEPGPTAPVSHGLAVIVRRVAVSEEAHRHALAFAVERRENPDLPRGQEREIRPGREGVLEVIERIVRVDGAVESRARVGARVLREPQARIIEVGTAPPPRPQPAASRSQPGQASTTSESQRAQEGNASWYDHPDRGFTAAHRSLPKGTVLTVTNLANGAEVRVTVNDRGPYVRGRIVDLSRQAFAQIADLEDGVIRVRITW